jgi:protein-tyrosine-phosphatase
MTTTPTVLFVCLHGSAKSLIALELFRRLAKERGVDVQADWAGIEPDAAIPPRVVQGLWARASTCADAGRGR